MNRPINKFLIVILISVIGIGLSTQFQKSPQPKSQTAGSQKPDHYFSDFTFYSLSEAGTLSWKMDGHKLFHLPISRMSHFTSANIFHYPQTGAPWHTTTATGEMPDSQEHLLFPEHVTIFRAASPQNSQLQIDTHELYYYPRTRLLTTKQKVKAVSPGQLITGIGMVAELDEQQIEVLTDVRATHQN